MNNYILRKIISYNKKNNKYTYKYLKNGKGIEYKKVKRYLKDIYIPPAYDNVQINTNQNSKVLAIGYDQKGRSQYIYNKSHTKSSNYNKFKKLIYFGDNYKRIINKINSDLFMIDESKNKQISMILKIIIECNFRICNDKYTTLNKSYGVSTLENRHITIKKNKIMIDFIGKKGVRNKCTLKNNKLSKNIRNKKKLVNKKDRIFSYRKGIQYKNITSNDVNRYLKELGDFTTKNFRTWGANIQLIKNLINNKPLKECINITSNRLHHTPSICKKNYLEPNLIKFYEKDPIEFMEFFKGDINNKFIIFLKQIYNN